MKLIEKKSTVDIKVLLSSLWIFFLLNMIVKDIHEIAKPEFLAASLARSPIPEELFLVAGILLEIPIAMVVLSRVLNYGINRWVNMIAAVLTGAFIFTNPPGDLDDIFFVVMELIALVLIVWNAWKWRSPELDTN